MSANFVGKTITDKLSRNFEYLRISVTDRCNFRCSYCMPSDIFNKDYSYISQDKILSYEEIIDICKLLKKIGLKKVRITGGEPLLRKNIDKLIFKLKTEVMLDRVSMTTNGSLLSDDKVSELKKSGLDSITLSLDTLDKDKISVINGTKKNFNLIPLLESIEKHFSIIKTNTVVIKGVNDDEIIDIINYMINFKSETRFIEYMDVGESNKWDPSKVVSSETLLERINDHYSLEQMKTENSSTAKKWSIKNTNSSIGLISSITQPFCSSCNRARLSVDGKLFTCLFASSGFDIKSVIRSDDYEEKLLEFFKKIWMERSDQYSQVRFTSKRDLPKVEMSYIGG